MKKPKSTILCPCCKTVEEKLTAFCADCKTWICADCICVICLHKEPTAVCLKCFIKRNHGKERLQRRNI